MYACAIIALMFIFFGHLSIQILCLFVLGICIGATITAASNTIMQATPPNRAGMAASIEEVSYELGSGLGIAIMRNRHHIPSGRCRVNMAQFSSIFSVEF
ncbi:protein of unknown function [Xenorhabdus poinarii G6]|uniref:Major facilitator superfamily (MFS) profile domain-containing protein n=1 Tax=Xenorhabdus poinarii G6 TaxID=1354304 RepID=A0A068R2L5_9GAMM|nr:hypothetical protein [Xenorhabdus poinarii]CDG21532.1 protein of unknown function [Xenorhabdus poinarii G6]